MKLPTEGTGPLDPRTEIKGGLEARRQKQEKRSLDTWELQPMLQE